jgi:hypothetical protein
LLDGQYRGRQPPPEGNAIDGIMGPPMAIRAHGSDVFWLIDPLVGQPVDVVDLEEAVAGIVDE